MTDEERILGRIKKTPGCWIWLGDTSDRGYGHVNYQKRKYLAHRAVYTILVGPIPKGLTLDHLCRNTSCVNPKHIEPVTQRENVLRGIGVTAQNARKKLCKRGHPFSKENTYTLGGYWRECKVCKQLWWKKNRKRLLPIMRQRYQSKLALTKPAHPTE